MIKPFSNRELYEIRESYRMIYEDASSKNRHYGREYTRKNASDLLGRTLQDGRKVTEWDVEKDIAGACKNAMEMAKSKFMLGATRIYLDAARNSPHDVSRMLNRLNQIIKIIASGHENEYDRNLNGMSFDDLEERFGESVYVEQEKDKEELGANRYMRNTDYDIVRINSFEEASRYGQYTSWCVTHGENMFDAYTGGMALFYFCLKKGFENVPREAGEGCPLDEYGLSMIAVLVNEDGSLKHCTCRWNHTNGGNDNIMDTVQISELLGVNFYDVFKPISAEEIMAGLQKNAVEDKFAERMGWLAVKEEYRYVNYVMNVNGYIRKMRKGFECVADGRRLMCVADRELLWYDVETGERVREPERVEPEDIEKYTFCECVKLKSVTIPDGVTYIGYDAFYGCTGLTSVTIPDSVTSIGENAFSHCSSLTNVTIGSGVTSIGDYAFCACAGLTSVNIPDGVTSIGDGAFTHCSGLRSVTIPDSVTNIRQDAFYGCSGLTSVTIPDSVTNIRQDAFYGCSGLTSVTIGNGVTGIGWGAFCGCTGLRSVTIPDSVTRIGTCAFSHCSGLTSVNIPDSVTSIGENAFSHCSGLTGVTIPNSVKSIGKDAFHGCSGLRGVTVPGYCRSRMDVLGIDESRTRVTFT